jgi:hypothetical protein
MADNKKSFLLYCDLLQIVKKLPKETQADLFIHILEYVNDLNPIITNNILLEIAFEPIKLQLKRDLVKYEGIKTKNAYNARKRWDAKDATASSGMRTDATASSGMRAYAKNADTDNDNDNDTVTDNDNVTDNDTAKYNKEEIEIFKIDEKLIFPNAENLDIELPSNELFNCKVLISNLTIPKVFSKDEDIRGLWTVFKAIRFNGQNQYYGWNKVYEHFKNDIKSQIQTKKIYKDGKTVNGNNDETKLGTSEARVAALKKW